MNSSYTAFLRFVKGVYDVMTSNWMMSVPLTIWLIYLARDIYNQIKKMVKGG